MEADVPTLVLMPGLDGTGLLFERFVSALPPHIRTRIIEYPKIAASLEEHAAVVAERLPAGRVVLLAESFSGIVALYLLMKHRVPAEKVIFVASFGSSPRRYLRMLLPFLPALAWSTPLIPSATWRLLFGGGCHSRRYRLAHGSRNPGESQGGRPSPQAGGIGKGRGCPAIDVPAYYLQSEGDRLVPRSAAEHLRRLFSHFILCAFRGRISCCRRRRLSLLS